MDNVPFKRPMGSTVVAKYEEHAHSPHGKLRHDLLFRYYAEFIRSRGVRLLYDVGGGSGLLLRNLLDEFRALRAVLIDCDAAMIDRAEENLSSFLGEGRVCLCQGTDREFQRINKSSKFYDEKLLVSFNHVIEYVDDQESTLRTLTSCLPEGSFFAIMYLNNSHEAFRQLMLRDSIQRVLHQLKSRDLDMAYFGMARALDADSMVSSFAAEGIILVQEYGIRCISDFKSREFVDSNYDEILEMEFNLGKMRDFMPLARYRLKFFLIERQDTSPSGRKGGLQRHAELKDTAGLVNQVKEGSKPFCVPGVAIYDLPLIRDMRGSLSFAEYGRLLPFIPKRYFVVFDVPSRDTRGEHAHRTLHQFLVCVKGSCSIVVDDGKHKEEILLDSPMRGIHVPPMVWCTQYKYSPDAVLLVLASDVYDADDYIRDYGIFLEAIKNRER
jgi:dTDP-4-dehydrorhamnose 3,5-epimerase-like enzyme/SAM-dependent methyltransferase